MPIRSKMANLAASNAGHKQPTGQQHCPDLNPRRPRLAKKLLDSTV
jgi:hypothetical protein